MFKTDQQKMDKATLKATKAEHEALQEFLSTPVGQARTAYGRGDQVFQYSQPVSTQKAVIVAMVGSAVNASTHDPSVILNAVCTEGWELVNGSFVFVEQGQQSRDKFISSGQNVGHQGRDRRLLPVPPPGVNQTNQGSHTP